MKKENAKKETEAIDVAPLPTVILTVKDRLLFQEFFPERGNLVTKIMEKDIAEKVIVGQEESKEIGLTVRPGGQGVTWKEEKAKDKAFNFSSAEIQFLKDQVERLDKAGAFTADTALVAKKIKAL
jgi:hypothetical protein